MDLFHKHITESLVSRCGSIEDTQHFFFHCRFYQGPRNTLLNACTTYQNPSLSLLQHYQLKQTLQFWNMITSIYLTPNVLPNQVSRYLRAIYTHIIRVFSLPTGLWCLHLSPTPTPAPTKMIFLAFTMMLSFFYNYCIYSLCSHKAVWVFFCSCTRFVFK